MFAWVPVYKVRQDLRFQQDGSVVPRDLELPSSSRGSGGCEVVLGLGALAVFSGSLMGLGLTVCALLGSSLQEGRTPSKEPGRRLE